jgi:hypothetical protein
LGQKQKNQNGGNSSGDGGMLVEVIYTTLYLADVRRLSGSAKSRETKPTIIQAEER